MVNSVSNILMSKDNDNQLIVKNVDNVAVCTVDLVCPLDQTHFENDRNGTKVMESNPNFP